MSEPIVNTSMSNWQEWQNRIYASLAQQCTANYGAYTPSIFCGKSSGSSTTSTTNGYESTADFLKRIEEQNKNSSEKSRKIIDFNNSEIDITTMSNELDLKVDNAKVTKNADGTETIVAKSSDVQKVLEAQKSQLENSRTKKDGSVVINQSKTEYKKNTPWWKRTLRAAGNMAQGVWKLATNFAGFEDGCSLKNWNWKKCLKNIGIAAGAIALCAIPGVGPVLSTALLASGVVAGTFGLTKGIVKATKAQTSEDIDKAFQDIGAGAFIGITSAVGLRGIGRSISTSGLPVPASSAGAGTTTNASLGSKIAGFFKEFKPSNIKQSFTDMTVNAWKATGQNIAASKSAVNANGFWSTFGGNLKNAFVTPTKDMINSTGNKIKGKYQNTRTSLGNTKNSIGNTFNKYRHASNWSWDMLYKVPLKLTWGTIKGTWKTGKFAVKTAFGVMGIPFRPWSYVCKTPAGAEFRIEQAINAEYETSMFAKTMTKDEFNTQKELLSQYVSQIKEQQDQIYGITGTSKALTA